MSLLLVAPVLAATVCPSGCDHTDVASAVAGATPGEVVWITAPGAYDASGLQFPASGVTVQAEADGVTLVNARVLPPYALGMRFERVTIDCGGGGFVGTLLNQQSLELSWVEVRNCFAPSGSIATTGNPNASVLIEHSWLHDLSADRGGVVSMERGEVTLDHTLVCDTSATERGGVVYRSDQSRELIVTHTYVFGASAPEGAVLYNETGGTVELLHNTFVGGVASPMSGGALNLESAGIEVRSNAFAYTVSGDAIGPNAPTGLYTHNGWWQNFVRDAPGDARGASAVTADPQLPGGMPTCDPLTAMPSSPSWLQGAHDGGAIGAFDTTGVTGPTAWDDVDGDGRVAVFDCDDTDPDVNDLLPEIACDGKDNDCDGIVDGGLVGQGYVDADGDGYGGGSPVPCGVDPLVGLGGDCDDADPLRSPGMPEATCNGVDDDCDTATLDEPDADGDGDPVCTDCDDSDPANSSIGTEICDGQDNDCDGGIDQGGGLVAWADADGDGFGDVHVPVFDCAEGVANDLDCDDTTASINPGAAERCDPLNVDEDCDGWPDDLDPEGAVGAVIAPVDLDGDGYADPDNLAAQCDASDLPATDCDDTKPGVHPSAAEIPDDGLDQDCDGEDPPYRYGNGSCGCNAGPGASGVWLLALALAARRRATRPRPRG
ncbi:MAG: putative metal-binding motif-containing protein [Alphaproteobacteria bacterium]|nr:putative metal-binding motif-containing protein [Alphaproteobacteria bacterium]